MAAADSSPATFRVSPEERYLLEAVAHYTGKSMSAFVRDAALVLARKVVDDAGPEAVLEGDRSGARRAACPSRRGGGHWSSSASCRATSGTVDGHRTVKSPFGGPPVSRTTDHAAS